MTATVGFDDLDPLRVDDARFVLAGDERRDADVVERRLQHNVVRPELVAGDPARQREALMRLPPQRLGEAAVLDVEAVLLGEQEDRRLIQNLSDRGIPLIGEAGSTVLDDIQRRLERIEARLEEERG